MCVCRLNYLAMRFLPTIMKPRIHSASYEYKTKSASNGAQLVPIGMPIYYRNIRLSNSTKTLMTYCSSFTTSTSEYFGGASE